MSDLVFHANRELEKAGLFSKDSDYEGMLGEAVMELQRTFADQGHSGFSAMLTLEIFNKVARFDVLSPVGSLSDEWMEVGHGMWQCTRKPSLFSHDEGKTWYDIDQPLTRLQKLKKWITR